jgi:hypothetical protein
MNYATNYTAGVTLNGHQLRDALSLIAPDGTDEQMSTCLSIQAGPARLTNQGAEPAGMFCWLAEYPGEGSVRLDELPREAPQAVLDPAQVLAIANRLIEAARWIYANAEARRQPDARALARIVLRQTAPIINAHIDSVCQTAHDSEAMTQP